MKKDKIKSKINQKALLDSVTYHKNKAGEIQAEKSSFLSSIDDLETLNKSLYDEVKKQKGNVIYISNINAKLSEQIDALGDSLNNIKYKPVYDSISKTYKVKWDFNKTYDSINYRILEGYTIVKWDTTNKAILNNGSLLTKNEMSFNITTGLVEDGNNLKIFVKSNYPNLLFPNIEGNLIDPNNSPLIKKMMKTKRWSIGPTVGYGIGITSFKMDFYLGFGISYSLFNF